MRNLIIQRLTILIEDSNGYGIPRNFDCDENENVLESQELTEMSDEELLEAFEAALLL
jgi:hypothetical protein